MTEYIKEWQLPTGGRVGIEDYEDGRPAKDHFMADQYQKDRKRFQVWCGGCGCGQYDTFEQAICGAFERIQRQRSRLAAEIAQTKENRAALKLIGKDILTLLKESPK